LVQPFIPDPAPKALLLIGAGASFGCGGLNARPPLGTTLYQELVSFSDIWASLPATHARAFVTDGFERAFDYWQEPRLEGLKSPMLWHMAFYFDRFRIADSNACAYVALAKAIIQLELLSQIAFVSLNYDTILEQAFLSLGVSIRGWSNFSEPQLAWFIKPHGSSNFLPTKMSIFAPGLVGRGAFNPKPNWVYPGQVCRESPPPLEIAQGLVHPIMAHYNRDKFARCGRDLIDALRNEWTQLALSAKIIAIIGVRPTIYDKMIWQSIATSPAKILFVNPNEQDCIEAQKQRSDITLLNKPFDSVVPEILSTIQNSLIT